MKKIIVSLLILVPFFSCKKTSDNPCEQWSAHFFYSPVTSFAQCNCPTNTWNQIIEICDGQFATAVPEEMKKHKPELGLIIEVGKYNDSCKVMMTYIKKN